jgi:NADH pyrophosphatase NudC (nudix superfamily)
MSEETQVEQLTEADERDLRHWATVVTDRWASRPATYRDLARLFATLDAERARREAAERELARLRPECRRCSDCVGEEHHWIDDACQTCRHCEVMRPYPDDEDDDA